MPDSRGARGIPARSGWGAAGDTTHSGGVILVDPWLTVPTNPDKNSVAELTRVDYILITHAHGDHFEPEDIAKVKAAKTVQVAPADVAQKLSGNVKTVKPGDRIGAAGVKLETVPAYNIVPGRTENHPKANNWVGYVIEIGGHRYYHAGDTDVIPEMNDLAPDVALLPVSGTYVMTADEAAKAARAIKPKVAVPMHYGAIVGSDADAARFAKLLEGSGIQVVIKKKE